MSEQHFLNQSTQWRWNLRAITNFYGPRLVFPSQIGGSQSLWVAALQLNEKGMRVRGGWSYGQERVRAEEWSRVTLLLPRDNGPPLLCDPYREFGTWALAADKFEWMPKNAGTPDGAMTKPTQRNRRRVFIYLVRGYCCELCFCLSNGIRDRVLCGAANSQFAKLRMNTARRNPARKQATAEHDETPTNENSKTLNKPTP